MLKFLVFHFFSMYIFSLVQSFCNFTSFWTLSFLVILSISARYTSFSNHSEVFAFGRFWCPRRPAEDLFSWSDWDLASSVYVLILFSCTIIYVTGPKRRIELIFLSKQTEASWRTVQTRRDPGSLWSLTPPIKILHRGQSCSVELSYTQARIVSQRRETQG